MKGSDLNLTAALVVRNELPRHLPAVVDHLRAFTDRIVVLDDCSDDGTSEWLEEQADWQLSVHVQERPTFYEHEGRTRARLLELTLEAEPTHVLSIDADEFVTDGPALRRLLEDRSDVPVWSLTLQEVWQADRDRILTREDGGWRRHESPLVWRPPALGALTFRDKALAVGRVPSQVRMRAAVPSGVGLLHVGWLREAGRRARYERYMKHDGGRFHARAHLQSILFPPARVRLRVEGWPAMLEPWKSAILA